MKSRKTVSVALLVVCTLSASYVWAQCASTGACCSAAAKAGVVAAVKPVTTSQTCPFAAAGIELTSAQQQKVMAILAKTHTDIAALLSVDQKAKFAKLNLIGAVLGKKACGSGSGCTKPCCADAKKACGPDCTKPCCAGEKKACGPDCTKPCCAAKTVEQTTCPIMKGNPINKSVFTVYQGKKIYFCCPGCDTAFNKNPKKYVKDLPQFKG
jgi:YHS domain-containing protein